MLQILCCYVNKKLSLDALTSFAKYARSVRMVNCTGDWTSRASMVDTMTLYWHTIRAHWEGTDDLVLLKQGKPVTEDTIPALESCPGVLCVQDDCTRYRKELQQFIPHENIGGDYMVWHLVEGRLSKLWEIHQIPICNHDGV